MKKIFFVALLVGLFVFEVIGVSKVARIIKPMRQE